MELLEGQAVAVIGLGREGQAAIRFLSQMEGLDKIAVCEEKIETRECQELLKVILGDRANSVLVHCGPLDKAPLDDYGFLIRSPGLSVYREELRRAIAAGCRVTTGSNLWHAAFCKAPTIAISGTKGKSTTAALIYHLLISLNKHAVLAGNIGEPLLNLGTNLSTQPNFYVLELSSYQLTDLNWLPDTAVLLNLFPAHTAWHGSTERYYHDKLRLFGEPWQAQLRCANGNSREIRNLLQAFPDIHWYNTSESFEIVDDLLCYLGKALYPISVCSLENTPMVENVCAALGALTLLGIDPQDCIDGLGSFSLLAHRFEDLGIFYGIRCINDSVASVPAATAAALRCLAGQSVTLLLGGMEVVGSVWHEVVEAFSNLTDIKVLCFGACRLSLAVELERLTAQSKLAVSQSVQIQCVASLAEGIERGLTITSKGGVLLLSPGCPSYDAFSDFTARGRFFREAIQESEFASHGT